MLKDRKWLNQDMEREQPDRDSESTTRLCWKLKNILESERGRQSVAVGCFVSGGRTKMVLEQKDYLRNRKQRKDCSIISIPGRWGWPGSCVHALVEMDEYSGFIPAEERDRSHANMWQRLYLWLSTSFGVKGFACYLTRHGSVMCLQGTNEAKKIEFQL